MVNYNPKSWVTLIFAFHRSDTFRMLWKEIIYIGLFTLAIAFLEIHFFPDAVQLEKLITVYSLIGFVISLLLVFRTNTAYDRWWEGRRKWGEVVNDTRNMAVKLSSILKEKADRDYFARMISNFAVSMKEHLRLGIDIDELNLTQEEKSEFIDRSHIPSAIVEAMYKKLKLHRENGEMSDVEFLSIDNNLNALLDSIGACERIKNTPIPFSYSLFIKKFIFIYVTTLPLAFVVQFGYFSALIATFVFYVLVSMEVLAEEIEDPFGTDDNDLPTDQLCERIDKVVHEVLA
jgi:ion channel-forming bestrophin family protein